MSSKENTKETAPKPIDLSELIDRFIRVFKRFWYIILIFALIAGALNAFRAYRSFTPMYESQALFSVNSGYTADDIFTASYYDNEAAKQLSEAFPNMLNTDIMRELMVQELGRGINGSISTSSVADTNMFSITVRSQSPQDAYDIIWAVINCYPQVAVFMVDNPQVIIREQPAIAEAPYNSLSFKGPVLSGMGVGAAVAVVILAVVAIFSKTVTHAEQLKALVNVPILSVLPKVVRKKRRKSAENRFVMVSSDDGLAESLRGLSLKMQRQLQGEDHKVILITSTLAGEGKTMISSNLALTMISEGLRVCLLDADFRKQSIAARYGMEPGRYSLMDCLRDSRISVFDAVQYVPETDLAFISGESVGISHYKIDSRAMERVIATLSQRFDYIIMDTSPFAIVSDTALLCRHAKCVLYTVKADFARQSQILDCVTSLYDRGISVAGFILNGVDRTGGHYGYGYKYGYGYGYGRYGYGGYGYGRYGYGYGYGNRYGYGSKYGYGESKKHKVSKVKKVKRSNSHSSEKE